MNIYKDVFPIDKESAERIFASGNVKNICHTMVAVAFHEKDWKWAQDKCLTFLNYDNPIISGLAATCLGHVARIHRKIDSEKVIEALKSRLNDDKIAGKIQDALDDIEMYISR